MEPLIVAAKAIHDDWLAVKEYEGVESYKDKHGEELIADFEELSAEARKPCFVTARAVLFALGAQGYELVRRFKL